MKIDIVIPAYNEETVIEASVREISATLQYLPLEAGIMVADNGSSDATAAAARNAGAEVLAVPARGKGAALRAAASHSQADYFAFVDADLSAHPQELPHLLTLLRSENADIVIGSRLISREGVHRGALRTLSSVLFNMFQRMVLGVSVKDTQCPIKVMNERGRDILAECTETGWFIDMELLARAEHAGLRILEVSVPWEEFRYAKRKSKLSILSAALETPRAVLRIRSTMK